VNESIHVRILIYPCSHRIRSCQVYVPSFVWGSSSQIGLEWSFATTLTTMTFTAKVAPLTEATSVRFPRWRIEVTFDLIECSLDAKMTDGMLTVRRTQNVLGMTTRNKQLQHGVFGKLVCRERAVAPIHYASVWQFLRTPYWYISKECL